MRSPGRTYREQTVRIAFLEVIRRPTTDNVCPVAETFYVRKITESVSLTYSGPGSAADDAMFLGFRAGHVNGKNQGGVQARFGLCRNAVYLAGTNKITAPEILSHSGYYSISSTSFFKITTFLTTVTCGGDSSIHSPCCCSVLFARRYRRLSLWGHLRTNTYKVSRCADP